MAWPAHFAQIGTSDQEVKKEVVRVVVVLVQGKNEREIKGVHLLSKFHHRNLKSFGKLLDNFLWLWKF
jgi:hypothetical protein